MNVYPVAERFTVTPGGRYYTDGEHSGQEFREEVLVPLIQEAIQRDTPVLIDFGGVRGMPPSFVEEAFGGLLRDHGDKWTADVLEQYVQIEAPNRPGLLGWVSFARTMMRHGLPKLN